MAFVSPQTLGHLAMLTFSALVAGSFSLGALVANDLDPAVLNAMRFGLSAVLIGAVVMATTGFERKAFAAPWRYGLLGALFATYFVLMFEGLKTAEPVSAAAVFTLTPVMTAVFGWFLLRQRTTPRMALALGIGACGALWVIFRADWGLFRAFDIGRGEVIYFWGCISHAIFTPMVRKLNRGEPAMVFSFGTMLAGCIVLVFWSWRDIAGVDWAALPRMVWITLFYLAVFASATTFVLLQFASLRLPSAKVMAYTYLTPSWVILWEIGLGGSAPPVLVLGGVGLTAFALYLLLRDDG